MSELPIANPERSADTRIPVTRTLAPTTTQFEDPYEITRKWLTYGLIWLLAGIMAVSGTMMFLMLWLHVPEGAHFVLDWLGISLGPVSALSGSAVTFYMERTRRG